MRISNIVFKAKTRQQSETTKKHLKTKTNKTITNGENQKTEMRNKRWTNIKPKTLQNKRKITAPNTLQQQDKQEQNNNNNSKTPKQNTKTKHQQQNTKTKRKTKTKKQTNTKKRKG